MVAIVMLPFCITIENACNADDGDPDVNIVVYDEDNNIICEKSGIEEGDIFVTADFYQYQIYSLEKDVAHAKKIGRLNIPTIKRGDVQPSQNSFSSKNSSEEKKICLYMTHNDESYVPSDGYDSIYGAGGIHDVALAFQKELEKKDINVVLDQTLHIPHNSSAYSRSSVTANKLLTKHNPNAMFDIHRDGVSKSYYLTRQGEKNYSKIRIVVGKSNPNFQENFKFAQNMFAIGNSMYPWLFSDIYCGNGHYNQSLQNTDLLFEMGTYLIEKEYVLNTLPLLAEVVNTSLYASKEENNGDIVVDNKSPITSSSPVSSEEQKDNSGQNNVWWIVLAIVGGGSVIVAIILIVDENNKKKKAKSLKNNKKSKIKKK